METITWTKHKLKAFERARAKATAEVFEFEGNEFLVGYADYLIEYLRKILC